MIWAGTGELMGQRAKRTTMFTVDLGELKAPWQAWCQAQGITLSPALRNALRQSMDRKATRVPAPRVRVSQKRERATARIELNLTTSELAALKRVSGRVCGGREPAHLGTAQAQFLPQPLDAPNPGGEPVGPQFCLESLWSVRWWVRTWAAWIATSDRAFFWARVEGRRMRQASYPLLDTSRTQHNSHSGY